ncbi:hypothetical protein ONE63_008555 [Megalurothrips usitatus]|uniref:Palmitoyltransferase n=1 Tax=Megalurothrips usitatus TaxID=439358 RepID=A0AAV7XU60_9NEOP|nr:hypothetical protein ONE63_008555 [Megalurothrips usitatus]
MFFLVRDPCGIVCIILTYLAVFYADYVIVKWVILQTMQNSLWGSFHMVMFNTVAFLAAMAHFRAMCSDPGTVPLPHSRMDFSDIHTDCNGGSEQEDWTVCTRCETYRPPRAHHCRICKRCIRRMDHHCPWINNCVGEKNQKYFLQFLVYVALLVLYAIALVMASWMEECPDCPIDIAVKQSRILHTVLVLVESLLFGLFVAAMLIDQLQAIFGDETAVEQAQELGPYRPHKPRMALLTEVCGRTHPLLWLLPCDTSTSRKSYQNDSGALLTHEV